MGERRDCGISRTNFTISKLRISTSKKFCFPSANILVVCKSHITPFSSLPLLVELFLTSLNLSVEKKKTYWLYIEIGEGGISESVVALSM